MNIFILLLFILFVNNAFSAPEVISIAGTLTEDSNISISGSDFGTKSSAAPKKWDNFENGINGNTLYSVDNSWCVYAGNDGTCATTGGVLYNSSYFHGGLLSVGVSITNGESFDSNFYKFTASDEAYVTYWWRTANGGVDDTTIIKMTRLNSSSTAGGGGVYNGDGNTSMGGTYNLAHGDLAELYVAYNDGDTDEAGLNYMSTPVVNTWTRVELYKKLSTAGVANGVFFAKIYGRDEHIDNAAMTRASGYSFQLDTILLGTMDGSDGNHSYEIYIDDIYIDTTRSRVEICNESTWNSRSHCEIQIPSAWSTGSIAITVNRGSFGTSDSAYLFVIDSDGNASDGYPITFGETYGTATATGVTITGGTLQ